LRIKQNVIDTYMQLCPVSTYKCESYSEVEYKVLRAISLGQMIEIREKEHVIGYYHLRFVIKNNQVVDYV
jgi:hypothetical protein